MLMNTLRNHPGGLRMRAGRAGRPAGGQRFPQAVYWRRRAVALLLAFAVLSLVAWAFFGTLGLGGAGAVVALRTSVPRHGSPGHGQLPAAVVSQARSQPPAARSGAGLRPCSRGDVVLSLVPPTQLTYTGRQQPQLTVDVVSTAGPACTFDVGARHVRLIIRSGSVRVWGSADCASGAGSLPSELQRGVPAMLSITWNRQSSAPGCSGPASARPAGTYSATATDGPLASNSVTFRLAG
jgi:hypothetical protein